MADHGPHKDDKTRTYRVSQNVRERLLQEQTRNWRRAQRDFGSPRRYRVRNQRVYGRSLIRGDLVTHRRQFGISHKSVQPGQSAVQ
ncbi:MAG: hypothetical protein JXN59_11925 [Anaerolineae bacterium]|nr:hypothetical protein [Anaerolineae bacterium]